MDAEAIAALIRKSLPEAEVQVQGADGRHFEAVIVCETFAGMPTLQRHRRVYAALGDRMGGEIHALALRTLAPGEVD